ncbi:hypothetical protein [Actinoplanes missouriensis]
MSDHVDARSTMERVPDLDGGGGLGGRLGFRVVREYGRYRKALTG